MRLIKACFIMILSLMIVISCARKNPNFKPPAKGADAGGGKEQEGGGEGGGGGTTTEGFGSAEVSLVVPEASASNFEFATNDFRVAEDAPAPGKVRIIVSGSAIKEPINKEFPLIPENKYLIEKIPVGKGHTFSVVVVDNAGKELMTGTGSGDVEKDKSTKIKIEMKVTVPAQPQVATANLQCKVNDTPYNVEVQYDKKTVEPSGKVRLAVLSVGLEGATVTWTKTDGEFSCTGINCPTNEWTAPEAVGKYTIGVKLIKGDMASVESAEKIEITVE